MLALLTGPTPFDTVLRWLFVALIVLTVLAAFLPPQWKLTQRLRQVVTDIRALMTSVAQSAPSTDPNVAPPMTKGDRPSLSDATRARMNGTKPPLTAFALLFAAAMLSGHSSGCTPSQAAVVESIAVDAASFTCSELAAYWQTEPGYVKFLCAGIQIIGGTPQQVQTIVKVPTVSAPAFRAVYVRQAVITIPPPAPSPSASTSASSGVLGSKP